MRKRRRSEPRNQCAEGVLQNPRGRRDNASSDPNLPDIKIPRKVIRGGSHLCAPELLLGFRCVVRNSGGMTPQTPFLSRRRDVTTDPVEIAMILAGILAVVAIVFVL